jgi:hypothetical protein
MADASPLQCAELTRLIGSQTDGNETNPVGATTDQDLKVGDLINHQGVNAILSLTTTAVEGKVGASRLVGRKYIEMQATTNNVKWGYDTTCPFDIFKNQFFSLPISDICAIYFKSSTGTASVSIGEK